MASPFKVFRKNQKAALAVLTVVAMGGFVVLPTVLQMMGGGGNPAAARREVVTTTRYGSLDEAAMAGLRGDRQRTLRFLNGIDRLVRTNTPARQTATQAAGLARQMPLEDEAIVQTWLLANRAEELGVVVDDGAVNTFIQELTEGVVTNDELIGTGGEDKGLLGQIELPEGQLFRLLKYELKAMRLQRLVITGMQPMTPGERWDYYQRLNRNMVIELAEVPVAGFTSGVQDPDEATLTKFFERYKDKENIPQLPEPGFRVPKRISVEYFKVDYDHLFEPGELEKYYEEHKEEFKRATLPTMEPSDPPELKGSLPGLDDPKFDLPPADGAAPDMTETGMPETAAPKTPVAKPELEEKQAEAPAPSEAKGDAPKPESAKPEESKPETPEKKTEDAPKPTDESRANRQSVFQLTAYQAEEKTDEKPADEKKADAMPAEEKPADEKKVDAKPAEEEPADEKKADAKPAEEKPADEKPADEKKADEKKADAKPAEEEPADEKKADAKPAEEKPADEKKADAMPAESVEDAEVDALGVLSEDMEKFDPPSEYETFEEVKAQIQNRLAPDKLEKIFRPLENQMTLYHDAKIRYIREQDDEGSSSVQDPPKLDFAELARKAGIEAKVTKLFSQREAMEREFDIADSRVTIGEQPVAFLGYAFDSLADLVPARSQDTEGNYYLFWNTQQEPERVPELDDEGVREMVVGAWKMIQARDAAHADAERLATVARDKQKGSEEPVSLATALSGEQGITVQSTDPFTWFDSISIQLTMMGYGQPRLSQIQIVAPEPKEGEEPAEQETIPLIATGFMRTVASLDKGSMGVAWNQPKTVAYVVRMVDTTPDAKDLQSQFLAAADPRQLGIVAQIDRGDAFREWIKGLETSVGLEWQR